MPIRLRNMTLEMALIGLTYKKSKKGIAVKEKLKTVGLVLLCFVLSVLVTQVIVVLIFGRTFKQLADPKVMYGITAIYFVLTYAIRSRATKIVCWGLFAFQLAVVAGVGVTQYMYTGYDYRMMALGSLVLLMFGNVCVDRILLSFGKISFPIANKRAALCFFWFLSGATGYWCSFEYSPGNSEMPRAIEIGKREIIDLLPKLNLNDVYEMLDAGRKKVERLGGDSRIDLLSQLEDRVKRGLETLPEKLTKDQ